MNITILKPLQYGSFPNNVAYQNREEVSHTCGGGWWHLILVTFCCPSCCKPKLQEDRDSCAINGKSRR